MTGGNMSDAEKKKSPEEQASEDLFNYAIERDDIKYLMAHLSAEATVKPTTVEYELAILKIISVGWSLSYFLEGTPRRKQKMSERFWADINEFSKGLSETTGLMIGQDIDYFDILKERLDMYLTTMSESTEATDPTTVIGPAFASACGNENDIFAAITGSKMFTSATGRVRQYLEALKLR